MTHSDRPASIGLRVLAASVGIAAVAGVAAIWMGVGVVLRGPCAWMAVVAALDAALLLRLAGYPRGRERAAIALVIVISTVVVAGYFYASAQIGMLLGMRPSESVWKMSPGLAWLYVRANTGWVDLAWVAGGLGVAWRGGR